MKIAYPLETKKRELDGAILLSSKLIRKGHSVFIGPKRELNYALDKIKPHLFIASNATKNQNYEQLLKHISKSNAKIMVIDTEGGVIIDELYKKRHHIDLLKYCDHFFAWGKKGLNLVHQATGFSTKKMTVSGVPWFDLLTNNTLLKQLYSEEIIEIEKEYGQEFILYNSRFSGTNTFNKEVKKSIDSNYSDNEYYRYSDKLFHKLNKSIEVLANNFPNYKIIIRPHPSEGKTFYENHFADYNNVFVDDRFSVRPWILLSKLMFHNGCTTAIESALIGKPTIAVQELINDEFDIKLPNDISERVTSNDELIHRIKEIFNQSATTEYTISNDQKSKLNEYIANISTNSTDKISEIINSIEPKSWKQTFSIFYLTERIKHYILNNHIDLIKLVSRKKYNTLKSFQDYAKNKFPYLKQEEISQTLNAYGYLGKHISIRPIKGTKSCYELKQH